MRKSMIGTILYTLMSCQLLWAQEKESDLDPVTVTATMSPEKISRTGRDIFVIRGERLFALPVHSIDELLRYLPGVEVQSRGPLGTQSDIVLRGGTFQQVLIVLDGVRLNDPNTGHFSSYIPISPAEIDRIEILKGASSALYGSEAVGGVIQIITRPFAARQGTSQSRVQAQVTGGQYDLLSVNAGGYYTNGKTSIGAGVLSNNTSGQPLRGIHGFVHAHTASLSLGHQFNDRWGLSVRYAYDDRKFAAQNFYTSLLIDTAREKVKTNWTQLALVYKGKRDRIRLNLGYKDFDDEYRLNPAFSPNRNKSKMYQALLTDEWMAGSHTTITSGAQFISKVIRSNDRGDHQVDQAAGFLIVNQHIRERIFVSPALRLEWNERSGWELVPQVNLSYRNEKFQLRGSAGKTIRDADFTERFNNYQKQNVGSGQRIGNPALQAERSFSYEAGGDYFLTGSVKLSGTFFQRFHNKLIDYVNTPYNEMPRQSNLAPGGTFALAKNISKVTTTGAEASLQYSIQMENRSQIWASFGITWLNSRSSEATPSFYISSHAKFLANFNIQYTGKRMAFGLNGLYRNRKPQIPTTAIAKVSADYFVLNAKLEGFILKNKLSVFAEADNVFDRKYTDLLGAQMPGRWLMGGIKISLSK